MSHENGQFASSENEQFIRDIGPYAAELEVRYAAALFLIDHGAKQGEEGNTAGGFIDEGGTRWTANHTVEGGHGSILIPETFEHIDYEFEWRGDDTAASIQAIKEWKKSIPKGHSQEGDVNLALIPRYTGAKQIVVSCWGEYAGRRFRPPLDWRTFHGFPFAGGVKLKLGDSGAPIVVVARYGEVVDEPYAVGLLHGTDGGICLFS